jgi:LysR family transcriptional regulator (chromosome initiation inhibitor)
MIAQERIIDFDVSDVMSIQYLKRHRLDQHVQRARHFVNNNEALITMISSGLGYGVLTEEIARPRTKTGELAILNDGAALENRLALAWYPRPQMPDYLEALVRAIL